MESVFISACDDLSSLWYNLKERFPAQVLSFKEDTNRLSIKIDYIDEFCKYFSLWYHRKIWEKELKDLLNESFVITKEEEIDILNFMKKFIPIHEIELSETIRKKTEIMLRTFHNLKINGFSIFCMEDYRKKMEEVIEEYLDEYLFEQEYYEFLEILQNYIQIEEEQFGTLTINAESAEKYRYYDENNHEITKRCITKVLQEFGEIAPDTNDCMIAILLLLLPQKIIINGIENIANQNILNTLKNVFGSRIELRPGVQLHPTEYL